MNETGSTNRKTAGHRSGAWVARVVRGGVFESLHRAHVVVTDADAGVVAALGNPRAITYVRSAIKPLQAAAALGLIHQAGSTMPASFVAIACASHQGSSAQQAAARAVLNSAGLDESALKCPPTLPTDPAALVAQAARPSRLAHNCSGKHAAFLLSQCASGGKTSDYLAPDSAVQRAVREEIARATGEEPLGPAVDGCGAPAWRCTVGGLATAFARLISGEGVHSDVRRAMSAHPELIGGAHTADTLLMRDNGHVIAKRGAEGVFAAGWSGGERPLGVAVKVLDGGDRAAGVVAAMVLHSLGAPVPDNLLAPLLLPEDSGGATLEVTGVVQSLV